jgi:hypothetical protein
VPHNGGTHPPQGSGAGSADQGSKTGELQGYPLKGSGSKK